MRWNLRQLESAAKDNFRYSTDFHYVFVSFADFNADVLTTSTVGGAVSLRAQGPWVRFNLHTHAWCGAIEITVNGKSRIHSIYTPQHGFSELRIDNPGDAEFEIVLKTVVATDPAAKANQLWVATVEFATEQRWCAKSMPVSEDCSLTFGRYGTFLTLTNDTMVGATIVNTGVWAATDLEVMEQHLGPGMVALDIGANIGHHTVAFSRKVGFSGRVLAFEPQRTIYRILNANCALNGCDNADLFQTCVGEEPGILHLFPVSYHDRGNFGALRVDPAPAERGNAKGEACRVDRLDTLLSELPVRLDRCDFIKIDVQSFELFVLKGASRTLADFKPTLFLEISPFWMNRLYDYRDIYHLLWSLGYEIEHVNDPSVMAGEIKKWNGFEWQEWDVLAIHPDRRR
jgi:FkbM family methyltransferase